MKSLVKKAMRGDKEAFTRLITQYSSDLYKVARGILNNTEDIADAIQNTILICFEKIDTLKQPNYFKKNTQYIDHMPAAYQRCR